MQKHKIPTKMSMQKKNMEMAICFVMWFLVTTSGKNVRKVNFSTKVLYWKGHTMKKKNFKWFFLWKFPNGLVSSEIDNECCWRNRIYLLKISFANINLVMIEMCSGRYTSKVTAFALSLSLLPVQFHRCKSHWR